MSCHVFYRASVEKDLDAIPEPFQRKIREAVKSLADDPRPPGFKKLAAMGNAYRIRIGQYRVGYLVVDRQLIVTVVAAAKRNEIYPLMKRRLEKQF